MRVCRFLWTQTLPRAAGTRTQTRAPHTCPCVETTQRLCGHHTGPGPWSRVPVDIGSRGRQTGPPRPFWARNRTLRHQMTNRDQDSAQNFKANPAMIVNLRDLDFFFNLFFQGSDLKIGFGETKTGVRARSARRAGAGHSRLSAAPGGRPGAPRALWGPGPYGALGPWRPR